MKRLKIPVILTFPVGTLAFANFAKLLLYTITLLPSCSFKVHETLPAPPEELANVPFTEGVLDLKLTLRIIPSLPASLSNVQLVGAEPFVNSFTSTELFNERIL